MVLFVHVAAVLPVIATWVVVKLMDPLCQVAPFQYLPSVLLCSVKVVLFAPRPPPPALSAALPLKLVGTPAVAKMLPLTGVVTEAMIGAVLSKVKVTALPATELPALSVAVARTV